MKRKKNHPHPVRIEFHREQAQAVFIAGTFNDWNANTTSMIALGEGRWVKELVLPPGRYEYRVIVDGQWTCDPAAAEQVSNSYGDFNSVLNVPPKPAA
jgi:1,4-alpha-glucan branching enzyme